MAVKFRLQVLLQGRADGPFEEAGEDGAEDGVVDFVDHGDYGVVRSGLDLFDFVVFIAVVCARGELDAAQIEDLQEEIG